MEGGRGKSEGKRRDGKSQKKERRQQSKTESGKQVTVGKKVHKRKDERHEGSKGHDDSRREGKGGQIEEKLHIEYSERQTAQQQHFFF